MDAGKNFIPVGRYYKNDDKYHIGRGTYLLAAVYDGVLLSKSPSSMVGNAIVSVFTIPVLLKSTKTGNISNKTVGRIKKEVEDVPIKNKAEKLNETKLAACRGDY